MVTYHGVGNPRIPVFEIYPIPTQTQLNLDTRDSAACRRFNSVSSATVLASAAAADQPLLLAESCLPVTWGMHGVIYCRQLHH